MPNKKRTLLENWLNLPDKDCLFKKKTFMENWLDLPAERCLFSKKPKPSGIETLSSHSSVSLNSDSEDENIYAGCDFIFSTDGIGYFGSDHQGYIEIIAVDKKTKLKVGKLDTDQDANGIEWLDNVHVIESHQRRGIGTNLINCALDFKPKLQMPVNTEHLGHHTKYYLSKAGAALINRCLALGIIDRYKNCGESLRPEGLYQDSSDEEIITFSQSSSPKSP